MGGLELDLKEYEDPAPRNLGHDAAEASKDAPTEHPPVAKKRKLPFRANISADGSRYKGRRASRADVELDAVTLGIFDEGDDDDRSVDHPSLESGDREDRGEDDALLEGGGAGSSIESDGADADPEDDLEVSTRKRQKELAADERAAVERLVRAEEEDLRKARVIQKQRDLYDSVVDMRIKLEPLMSLARTFPNASQRKESPAWNENEELRKAFSTTESALASLCEQAEGLSKKSWQAYESDDESDDMSDDENEENAKDFALWRNGILDEWARKVNEAEGVVPKGGFKTIDTSMSAQMKASLASGKHLARTRRVRETVDLVGGLELEQGSDDMQYDDGELYRTLLRDIIESGDAAGGGLRFAQLSKGGRIKKKRDTSFAKGKRLRYSVHEKLVGFLAPLPMPDPGPVDEIIANLFGRMGTVKRVD